VVGAPEVLLVEEELGLAELTRGPLFFFDGGELVLWDSGKDRVLLGLRFDRPLPVDDVLALVDALAPSLKLKIL